MNGIGIKRFFTTLTLLLIALAGTQGQSVEELQREIDAAQAEIRAANELLSKTENDRKNNRSLLQLVQRNIANRQRIVTSLDEQIRVVNRQVNAKTRSINLLQEDLSRLKTEYATLVRATYKSQQNNNALAFLFAAQDFNDVTRRIFYIKRYTRIREQKAEQIDSVSHQLQVDIEALSLQKDSLNAIVGNRNAELSNLSNERQNYQKIDRSLSSQARQYNQKIADQQRRIKSIQDQIQRIIAEEARKSQATPRSAEEEESFIQLTGRFDQNRGKLPYPVSGGVIIEKYGSHPHPTQRGVTVNNKGVNIATERGAAVRTVFEGDVVRVFLTPGANNTVMIRHGNYFTTYSNLETVAVKVGDKVSGNQQIGNVYSGANAENYILPFTIWNGTQTQNPETWLKR
ncbi:MAG: peptidoglycan DD-metalloendopeptidase family protein [Rikenellaceae bacterium]|jgi:septal ring factor EnvC (AmiA/AmiB activator)|nr:peptidoglycan DD-metalloendopeptidase family protein [Rikenellaceae bacterium]